MPQSVQASDPAESLYLPATHASHAPPSGPVYPTLQEQSTSALLPASDTESVGQLTQVSGVVAPAVLEYLPLIQSTHQDAEDAPVMLEYFPLGQFSHEVLKHSSMYLPASQGWQKLVDRS